MAAKTTPLIAQYLSVKRQVPDALLFFRLGDFYEMFFEDAETGARLLGLQLTSRSKDGVPLCGVPYHAAEPYIARLLRAGQKVAVCEQAPGEAGARGLIPRRIVRLITPGTVGEEVVLTAGEKSYLVALAAVGENYALSAIDVSTGEFLLTASTSPATIHEELARLSPREVLIARSAPWRSTLLEGLSTTATELDPAQFDPDASRAALTSRFGAETAELDAATAAAAGACLSYVEHTFGVELAHLRPPALYHPTQYLTVDEVTRRHLELIATAEGSRDGSLLSVLDQTLTPMGARTLRNWLLYPLLDLAAIAMRHDAVAELFESDLDGPPAQALRAIGDLERTVGRIGSLRASPREIARAAGALDAAADLARALTGSKSALIRSLAARLRPRPDLAALIRATLRDDPPVNPREGNLIRPGLSAEADELRDLAAGARAILARIESAERQRTGISTLKVRYNQVFGYYIEVTKAHLERVPADYERKQTLVGGERFTTAELKEVERRVLSAESSLKELELRLYGELLRKLSANAADLSETALAVGQFDALMSLARVARKRGYVRPEMNSGLAISVRDGRHPVLETLMRAGEFVSNDLEVDPDERQLLLITGPNMAGKSTYLRQAALIVIVAQMGGFVPALEAKIGLVDRVMTRIGARDELRRGESTFMVEMRETARLIGGLTDRSLLLLDEVGRGTSTFDGLAIAWAVAEYLHDRSRAKVLFATHFHELVELARDRPRVNNLSVAVKEWGGEVLFLHRVTEGAASRSYGIEVARLAGLPAEIVTRAREILSNLEGDPDHGARTRGKQPGSGDAPLQMALFGGSEARALAELRALEVDRMTPVDALVALSRLVGRLRSDDG